MPGGGIEPFRQRIENVRQFVTLREAMIAGGPILRAAPRPRSILCQENLCAPPETGCVRETRPRETTDDSRYVTPDLEAGAVVSGLERSERFKK